MPVHFPLEFHPLLLRLADLLFLLRKLVSPPSDFRLAAHDIFRNDFRLRPRFFRLRLADLNFHLQQIKLVPGQLGVQMLQFQHELLVAPRLARLALERPDLPFYLANQVRHPQQILFRRLQLAQRLLFLRLEFGDARRLLKYQAALLRFA